jgi:ubiquinone biosynthesis protein
MALPEAVKRLVTPMQAVRLVTRGFLIGFTILLHCLFWFLGWLVLILSFRGKEARRRWQGERFRCLLRDLGATYVKVGQIISTRPDIFPPHIIHSLEKLQDDVGGFSEKKVRAILLQEFGKDPDTLFQSFDPAPIASASVAQVHSATLADGSRVAIKVQRPGIERTVAFDLSIMTFCARLLEIIPLMRLYAPVASAKEFGRAIEMQIDFTIEAENNRRFHENFDAVEDIVLPDLVPELCSKRVLTMSFIEGVKILHFRDTDANPTALAKIGFHTLLKMIFDDGFVHADLHPGNIFITPDNKVALIDLGLTAELSDEYRRVFAEFFGAWAGADGKNMARLMVKFSPKAEVRDYPSYEAEICEFVKRYDQKMLGDVQLSAVIFDMMGIMRRHRVRVNAVFTMVNLAIAVTEGLGRQLDDRLDLLSETVPFFVELRQSGRL